MSLQEELVDVGFFALTAFGIMVILDVFWRQDVFLLGIIVVTVYAIARMMFLWWKTSQGSSTRTKRLVMLWSQIRWTSVQEVLVLGAAAAFCDTFLGPWTLLVQSTFVGFLLTLMWALELGGGDVTSNVVMKLAWFQVATACLMTSLAFAHYSFAPLSTTWRLSGFEWWVLNAGTIAVSQRLTSEVRERSQNSSEPLGTWVYVLLFNIFLLEILLSTLFLVGFYDVAPGSWRSLFTWIVQGLPVLLSFLVILEQQRQVAKLVIPNFTEKWFSAIEKSRVQAVVSGAWSAILAFCVLIALGSPEVAQFFLAYTLATVAFFLTTNCTLSVPLTFVWPMSFFIVARRTWSGCFVATWALLVVALFLWKRNNK